MGEEVALIEPQIMEQFSEHRVRAQSQQKQGWRREVCAAFPFLHDVDAPCSFWLNARILALSGPANVRTPGTDARQGAPKVIQNMIDKAVERNSRAEGQAIQRLMVDLDFAEGVPVHDAGNMSSESLRETVDCHRSWFRELLSSRVPAERLERLLGELESGTISHDTLIGVIFGLEPAPE